MGKGRLEAFSDGVIAVIITIMVLELKAPHGTDLAALAPLAPALFTYVLSFVYVGIYWNNHHHLLRRPAHRRPRPLGEPAPALLALARAVYDRLGRRVSQGRHTDGDLRGSVFDGRCRVVAAAGCAGQAKRAGVTARACRRAGPEGQVVGAALCLGDPAGLRQSLDRRRPLCAGRTHLVHS